MKNLAFIIVEDNIINLNQIEYITTSTREGCDIWMIGSQRGIHTNLSLDEIRERIKDVMIQMMGNNYGN